ncbi:alpha-amylase [Williamsia sp. 1138]|uniref:alpha-amylase family protein n=1 Tax=Williamsia sp. 1138 TaxID=1903117 RepID=UPI000A0FF90B|nr:alpha-amylase family protein [Williamsia sp. 1138]OZG27735.1 alpha-amylase [Williamsia sp. 1138]
MEHVIWWQVYPLGFVGAEATSIEGTEHRLDRIVDWFDYLLELGCNGLSLGPVFASSTHGYDTIDHFRIDSRLGETEDLERLIAAAHDRGIKVMLDGVFNHVGRDHPKFRDALRDGSTSEAGQWFRWDGDKPFAFEGHDILVTLNHDNPAVQQYIGDVMTHWLDRGIDAWRLDAAYAIDPSLFRTVLPPVRERAPAAWFVGEMIHGDYEGYVAASGLDSVTQYELWKAMWSSLNDENLFELGHAIERNNGMLEAFVPATFVGNHDVTRIASTLSDERMIPIAVALLFFLAGVPSVYYGDEQGFRGVKEERVGGDDAIRPVFPAGPDELAPYGRGLFELHQALIGVRRRHSWLHSARTEVRDLSNRSATLISRSSGEELILTIDLTLLDSEPAPHGLVAANRNVVASGPGWSIAEPASPAAGSS